MVDGESHYRRIEPLVESRGDSVRIALPHAQLSGHFMPGEFDWFDALASIYDTLSQQPSSQLSCHPISR